MKMQPSRNAVYSLPDTIEVSKLSKPAILGFFSGGRGRDLSANTKYGLFFEALARRFDLLGVHDVDLNGYHRLMSGVLTFHPNRKIWKERYYKNIYSFNKRSHNAAHIQNFYKKQADLVLQVGVLFDAYWEKLQIPNIIYTDWTSQLSAQNPYRYRSPFLGTKLAKWLNYESKAFQRAIHIFTRSELVRKNIVQEYGIPLEKVTTVGGGVSIYPFPEQPILRQMDFPTLLFIGSDFKRKGGEVLLQAFSLVHNLVPCARLRLLTRDAIPDGLPLENVEVLPYIWDREMIYRLYKEADVFVLPSREETWGDVLLEAAAFGLPSIGVEGGVMNEVIKDGETGFLTALDDASALANVMRVVLENADLRRQLGKDARIHVESTFTWDHVVERMALKIESILSRKEQRH